MTFGSLHRAGIPRIQSYARALKRYNDIAPIAGKGLNAGIRPLGARNRPWLLIDKGSDDQIVCTLYRTDVVTFHPDGLVKINSGGYNTRTTCSFIQEVLGVATRIMDNKIIVSLSGRQYTLDGELLLRYTEGWEVLNPTVSYVHTINRKVINKARKELEPFMQYLRGSVKLRDEFVYLEERDTLKDSLFEMGINADSPVQWPLRTEPHWGVDNTRIVANLHVCLNLMRSEDRGNWYTAFCWLAYMDNPWKDGVYFTENQAEKRITNLILVTCANALVVTPVANGEVKKDRYEKIAKLTKIVLE